jgi:orotate phosphoribosyltransferase
MRLEQLPLSALEVSKNIVRFSTPLILETHEISLLVRNVFIAYKEKINPQIHSLTSPEHEANALIYSFRPLKGSPVYFSVIFDSDQTHFSIETSNSGEALKIFRLLRDQYQIVPELEILTKLKGSFSEIVAALLWQIGAIKVSLGDTKPFFKVDNRKNYSPIYIDIKVLSSFPLIFDFVIASASLFLEKIPFDLICGIEAGSIVLAHAFAQKFLKPSFFARRSRRYPEAPLLEGINPALLLHKKVLVVDDTIVSGQTKLKVVQEIRKLGGQVDKCFVIFDRKQQGREVLKKAGIELLSLTDIKAALSVNIPREITQLTVEEYQELKSYFKSPKRWHEKHGFKYYEESKEL